MIDIKEVLEQILVDIDRLDELEDVDEILQAVDALNYDIGLLRELIDRMNK